MQSEEPVEIDRGLSSVRGWLRYRDRRTQFVVGRFTKRHNHVESIDRATLKDRNQRLTLSAWDGVAHHHALEKRRRGERHTHTRQSDAARLEKESSIHNYCL